MTAHLLFLLFVVLGSTVRAAEPVSCRDLFQSVLTVPVLNVEDQQVHDLFEAFRTLAKTSHDYQVETARFEALRDEAEDKMDKLGEKYSIPKERGGIAHIMNNYPDFSKARVEFHNMDAHLKKFRKSFEGLIQSQELRLTLHFKNLGERILEQAMTISKEDPFWKKLNYQEAVPVDPESWQLSPTEINYLDVVIAYKTGRVSHEGILGLRDVPEVIQLLVAIDFEPAQVRALVLRQPYTKQKSPALFHKNWVKDL